MARSRVLDVGNCDSDHGVIRALLVNHFDVEVDRVMFVDEALLRIARQPYDLVLVNRRIFADDRDGLELIRRLRATTAQPAANARPAVMMVSNFEAAQQAAIAAGAVRGFGKAQLRDAATLERLALVLPRTGAPGRDPRGVAGATGRRATDDRTAADASDRAAAHGKVPSP